MIATSTREKCLSWISINEQKHNFLNNYTKVVVYIADYDYRSIRLLGKPRILHNLSREKYVAFKVNQYFFIILQITFFSYLGSINNLAVRQLTSNFI